VTPFDPNRIGDLPTNAFGDRDSDDGRECLRPITSNGSIDVNRDGIQAARRGEGLGVGLYVAGGVAHSNSFNVTVVDAYNILNTIQPGGALPYWSP